MAGVFLVDDVVEVVAECFFVCARVGDALAEVEDKGGEAGGREVDFLVVGDLAYGAVFFWVIICVVSGNNV